MDHQKVDLVHADGSDVRRGTEFSELNDLQLALVGGGIGDPIAA
jgi:hypothetical protein